MADAARFVLVTGLSGAGKSQTLRFLEDLGYFCVDNLPASLVAQFAELVLMGETARLQVAACVDGRSGEDLVNLPNALDDLREQGLQTDVLYLETSKDVLLRRYSETLRRHPSSPDGTVEAGIAREQELLGPLRDRADLRLDTSTMTVAELRDRVTAVYQGDRPEERLAILVQSFGFKFGVPPESDLVLDVRFLPNPHWEKELREWTGIQPDVRDYVLDNPDGAEFLDRTKELLAFLIPRYEKEPKAYLTVSVGCTGGRHRSVAVANALAMFLRDQGKTVRLRHRDIDGTTSGGR